MIGATACRGMFVESRRPYRVSVSLRRLFTVSNEFCIIQNFILLRGIVGEHVCFVTEHMFSGQ